jgi:hypothetical protein
MLAMQHTGPAVGPHGRGHVHEIPPCRLGDEGLICRGAELGATDPKADRPYLVLGILGAVLLGGAALIYRDAKKRGE